MPQWIVVALLALNLLLLAWVALRRPDDAALRRLEGGLRDELGRVAQATRADLGTFQQVLVAQAGDAARTQNEQIDTLRRQAAAAQAQTEVALRRFSETLAERLQALSDANERRLAALQEGNERKLEQMRATVDEKLQSTLDQRLGESFRLVSERLEQVHKGLGEMQSLAIGVGDLKRVLTNVKTRGILGEVQLGALLDQLLTIDQYDSNVVTVPGSNDRVEFAVRMPGAGEHAQLYLPIDAKFPIEDYQRLLDAQEAADADAAALAGRALEMRVREEAKRIRSKYVAPPHTTDFAVLFLPTEGLYAEVIRRPGLFESLQRDHHVTVAGPTTLTALLNSLQMGFRTLAIAQRSSEVWTLLGAVKTEFGKFGAVLDKTRKKLNEASNVIDQASVRTRAIERKLRGVETLNGDEAQQLLIDAPAIDDISEDDTAV